MSHAQFGSKLNSCQYKPTKQSIFISRQNPKPFVLSSSSFSCLSSLWTYLALMICPSCHHSLNIFNFLPVLPWLRVLFVSLRHKCCFCYLSRMKAGKGHIPCYRHQLMLMEPRNDVCVLVVWQRLYNTSFKGEPRRHAAFAI